MLALLPGVLAAACSPRSGNDLILDSDNGVASSDGDAASDLQTDKDWTESSEADTGSDGHGPDTGGDDEGSAPVTCSERLGVPSVVRHVSGHSFPFYSALDWNLEGGAELLGQQSSHPALFSVSRSGATTVVAGPSSDFDYTIPADLDDDGYVDLFRVEEGGLEPSSVFWIRNPEGEATWQVEEIATDLLFPRWTNVLAGAKGVIVGSVPATQPGGFVAVFQHGVSPSLATASIDDPNPTFPCIQVDAYSDKFGHTISALSNASNNPEVPHDLVVFDLGNPAQPVEVSVVEVGFEVRDIDIGPGPDDSGLMIAVADGSRTVSVIFEAGTMNPEVQRVAMDADTKPAGWDWEHGTTELVAVANDGRIYASVIDPDSGSTCLGVIETFKDEAVLVGVLDHIESRPITRLFTADLDGDGGDEVIVSSRESLSYSSSVATMIYWSDPSG